MTVILYFGLLALLLSGMTMIGLAVWLWRGTVSIEVIEDRWVFRAQLLVIAIAFAGAYGVVLAQIIQGLGRAL
jgi:hypothetical protein